MEIQKFEINVPGRLSIRDKVKKEWVVDIDADVKQFELFADHEHTFSFTPSETTTKEDLRNLNCLLEHGTLKQLDLVDSADSIEFDLIGWEMLKGVEDINISELAGFDSFKFLEEMPNLTSLTAFDSEITDDGLKALQNARDLDYLGLDNTTKLTKKGFEYLRSLDVKIMELYGCDYVDDDFIIFIVESFPNLSWIDLMTCKNITDESIRKLSILDDLVEVCLTDCPNLTPKSVDYLADFKSLKFLTWGMQLEKPMRETTNDEIIKFLECDSLIQLVLNGINEASIDAILELKKHKNLKNLFMNFDKKISRKNENIILENFPDLNIEI